MSAFLYIEGTANEKNWDPPTGATDNQVLLMTTCMETWIVADRALGRECPTFR